jgi:hypothetical protein
MLAVVTLESSFYAMAGSLKKTLRQWLDKAALQKLPSLRPDTRIQEINTDNNSNKYGYLYNIYYPEHITKEPIGVVFHKDKFYQFFHSSTTGNPYLGVLLKKANQYEFQDNVSTEDKEDKGAEEQLTLQIRNSLVTVLPLAPGSLPCLPLLFPLRLTSHPTTSSPLDLHHPLVPLRVPSCACLT